MKRFLAGVIVGLMGSALILAAQHRASDKVVEPQPIFENSKVKIQRWLLKPGEGTPLHTHALDHVSVVIHGSTLQDVDAGGGMKEMTQKSGEAVYVPATGKTHSFANVGKAPFESISIELK